MGRLERRSPSVDRQTGKKKLSLMEVLLFFDSCLRIDIGQVRDRAEGTIHSSLPLHVQFRQRALSSPLLPKSQVSNKIRPTTFHPTEKDQSHFLISALVSLYFPYRTFPIPIIHILGIGTKHRAQNEFYQFYQVRLSEFVSVRGSGQPNPTLQTISSY